MSTDCQARAQRVQKLAADKSIAGQLPYPMGYTHRETVRSIAQRLAWDAHAASEYLRPILSDATDVAAVRPDLAHDVWHHAAGAAIVGGYCCGTPAAHRDALVALAERMVSDNVGPVDCLSGEHSSHATGTDGDVCAAAHLAAV